MALREACYEAVKEAHDPEQITLSQFGGAGETTIAVVRKPTRGIEEVCDEWYPELGMPSDALDEYWSIRSAYNQNQYVSSTEAANRAFSEANLEERFSEYVKNSPEAQKRIDEIVERLESGEDITLVCFEGGGKKCHRHILKSMIASRQKSGLRSIR